MSKSITYCKNCKAPFTPRQNGAGYKYCSTKCRTLFQNEQRRINNARYYQEHPELKVLATLKQRAAKAGLEFDLDAEWIKKQMARGRCARTGLPLKPKMYRPGEAGIRHPLSPSWDRIDNDKGYTKSNVQLVCCIYNLTKNDFVERDLNVLALSLVISNLSPSLVPHLLGQLPPGLVNCLPPDYLDQYLQPENCHTTSLRPVGQPLRIRSQRHSGPPMAAPTEAEQAPDDQSAPWSILVTPSAAC